jgi:hypothetical protein
MNKLVINNRLIDDTDDRGGWLTQRTRLRFPARVNLVAALTPESVLRNFGLFWRCSITACCYLFTFAPLCHTSARRMVYCIEL